VLYRAEHELQVRLMGAVTLNPTKAALNCSVPRLEDIH
jgi:hypothetical protein